MNPDLSRAESLSYMYIKINVFLFGLLELKNRQKLAPLPSVVVPEPVGGGLFGWSWSQSRKKRPAPVPAPAPVILVYFTSQNISLLPFNYKDKIDHFCVMTAKSVNNNVYFPSCQLGCEPFEGW